MAKWAWVKKKTTLYISLSFELYSTHPPAPGLVPEKLPRKLILGFKLLSTQLATRSTYQIGLTKLIDKLQKK